MGRHFKSAYSTTIREATFKRESRNIQICCVDKERWYAKVGGLPLLISAKGDFWLKTRPTYKEAENAARKFLEEKR
jgi:hypothetical protein